MTTDHIRKAAEAHTNLSMFHAIISLCESGGFCGYHPECDRIIAICHAGAAKQLRAYDKEIATLSKSTPKGSARDD